MENKIAVVTGSNKGIGFGIVKELCKRGVGVVYLTARDEKRGLQAVEELKKEDLHAQFYQLDVTDEDSVKSFAEHIKNKHNGLDILINNAGVSSSDFRQTTYEDAKRVIDTNYSAVLLMQKYFFPILNRNARVINVSSAWGHIGNLKNPFWRNRLLKDDLSLEDVNAFVNWFLESVKNNSLKEDDFIESNVVAYRASKVALCALTRVQQKEVDRNISVNSLHPGFVRTTMTKGGGEMTIEESGETAAYLALDVDQSVKGKYFWSDKREVDWTDYSFGVGKYSFEYFMQCVEEANK